MRPIFILEHVRISSPEKLTISIMEGISSMVESIPSSSSIDTIINHIDEHSYDELYNYIKMIFNDIKSQKSDFFHKKRVPKNSQKSDHFTPP